MIGQWEIGPWSAWSPRSYWSVAPIWVLIPVAVVVGVVKGWDKDET